MIRLGKLRWKNLLATGNVFTEMDLSSPGTTLVIGPNGGGKSTITEALSFALYGKPFRKVSKNQLVNSINRKDLLVECEFRISGREFMIRRGMKPSIFEIYADGELLNMEGKTADQQDFLEKNILRINYRAFMQVVVLGAASYVPFMELPAQHRREVLEDLLDMRVLGVMMDMLKPMLQEIIGEMKDADHRRDIILERISMRQKFDDAVRNDAIQRRKAHEDRISELESIASTLIEEGRTLFEKHETLRSEMDPEDYDGAISTVRDVLSRNGSELNRVRERLAFFGENQTCPHCDQVVDDRHRERIEDELRSVEKKLVRTMGSHVDQLSSLKVKAEFVSRVKAEMADIRTKLTDLKYRLENVNRSIEYERTKMSDVGGTLPTIDLPSLTELESDLLVIDSERKRLHDRRLTLGNVHSVLQDGGAKARIIGTYIPMINQLINGFLKDLDCCVEFELDSEFNESIRSRYRDEFTYSSFSEGEKMRINLAILFTWRAVAKAKNSVSTNVVIMDEIFDSSLDPSGAEELMRLLNRITGDSSVIIISHRSDQMADKFDRVVKFHKEGNFSVKTAL